MANDEWETPPSGAAQELLENETLTRVLNEFREHGIEMVANVRLDSSGEDKRREGASYIKAVEAFRDQLKTLARGVKKT